MGILPPHRIEQLPPDEASTIESSPLFAATLLPTVPTQPLPSGDPIIICSVAGAGPPGRRPPAPARRGPPRRRPRRPPGEVPVYRDQPRPRAVADLERFTVALRTFPRYSLP